jgi:hypothetical protein
VDFNIKELGAGANASYEVLHRMNMIDVLKRYPEVATSVVQ